MQIKTAQQIISVIEGVVQLCLGKSGCVFWIERDDAASFADGERIYLPRPKGGDQQEYELLLAIAMREVAKVLHSETADFVYSSEDAAVFASVVEDVRVKARLRQTYLGSPRVFRSGYQAAVNIVQAADVRDPLGAARLAVWMAANEALNDGPSEASAANFTELAVSHLGEQAVHTALKLAAESPFVRSTAEAVLVGEQICELMHSAHNQGQGQDQQAGGDQAAQGQDNQGQGQDQQAGGDQAAQGQDNQGQGQDQQAGGDQAAQGQDNQGQGQGQQAGGDQGAQGQDNHGQGQDQQAGGDQAAQGQGNQGQGQGQQAGGDQAAQGHGNQGQGQGQQAGGDQAAQGQGNQGQGQGQQAGGDVLSDALAILRGYQRARMCPGTDQRSAEPEGGGVVLTRSERKQIAAALHADGADGGNAMEAVFEAMAEPLAENFEPDLGAGDGYAPYEVASSQNTLSSVPSRLVSVLLASLHDRKVAPVRRGHHGNRVDAKRVWRMKVMGDMKVFHKRDQAPGIDAAVSILLDRSTSMSKNMELAVQCAHSFALALQRVSGVQSSIDVFPGTGKPVQEVMAFKGNLAAARKVLEGIGASGGTPTGEAVEFRIGQLLQTRAEKRLLIVITDGQPGSNQIALLKANLELAKAHDIQVLAIGIGADARVETHFKTCTSIQTIEELPAELRKVLKTTVVDSIVSV